MVSDNLPAFGNLIDPAPITISPTTGDFGRAIRRDETLFIAGTTVQRSFSVRITSEPSERKKERVTCSAIPLGRVHQTLALYILRATQGTHVSDHLSAHRSDLDHAPRSSSQYVPPATLLPLHETGQDALLRAPGDPHYMQPLQLPYPAGHCNSEMLERAQECGYMQSAYWVNRIIEHLVLNQDKAEDFPNVTEGVKERSQRTWASSRRRVVADRPCHEGWRSVV
ncbi:hypothetical protein BC826DRAFT_974045 [Russula brevipes]|nr:hypothetical protein BC826DRAFT_974045 [Russula brevipes]